MRIETIQQTFGFEALLIWKAISFLGDGLFVFIAFSLFALTIDVTKALQVGFVGAPVGIVVGALKVLIQQPRPYLTDLEILPLQISGGFAMASGNSTSAAGLFILLWVFRRIPQALILSIMVIFLVGVSRLYLGVHTWEKVIAGWVLGISVVGFICGSHTQFVVGYHV